MVDGFWLNKYHGYRSITTNNYKSLTTPDSLSNTPIIKDVWELLSLIQKHYRMIGL